MVSKWIVLYHLHLSWIVRNKPLEKPYSILIYFTTAQCLHLWSPRAGRMTRAHPQMMGVAVVSRENACNRLIQPRSSRRNVSTDASPCKHDIKVFWTYKWWDWRETPRAPCGAMRHIGTPQGMGLVLGMGCDCCLERFMILFLLNAHLRDFETIFYMKPCFPTLNFRTFFKFRMSKY